MICVKMFTWNIITTSFKLGDFIVMARVNTTLQFFFKNVLTHDWKQEVNSIWNGKETAKQSPAAKSFCHFLPLNPLLNCILFTDYLLDIYNRTPVKWEYSLNLSLNLTNKKYSVCIWVQISVPATKMVNRPSQSCTLQTLLCSDLLSPVVRRKRGLQPTPMFSWKIQTFPCRQ